MATTLGTNLHETEYIKIKALLKAGFTVSEVRKLVNRSLPLVKVVNQTKDWADYVAYKIAYNARRQEAESTKKPQTSLEVLQDVDKPKAEQVNEIVLKPTDVSALLSILNNTNTSLTEMNGRLKWIEDNIEVPERRRFR